MKSIRYQIPIMLGSTLIGAAVGVLSDSPLVGALVGSGLAMLISIFFINEE